MGRVNFRETAVVGSGASGSLFPLEGIAYVPYMVNPDGSQGSQAQAYADRTSNIVAPSFITDAVGSIAYWLNAGDYNIDVSDQQSPPRIDPYIMGFTAPIVDTAALLESAQGVLQFTGDLKFSMQISDHGVILAGGYEWLLVNSDIDGGGRKLDHLAYPGLWDLMGSPALDGSGNFRLPNISGRTLIATGAAASLTNRNLLDLLGEEVHLLTGAESGLPQHAHDAGSYNPIALNAPGTSLANTNNGGGYEFIPANSAGGVLNNGPNAAANSHNNMPPSIAMNLFVKS
jgi:microcystin-dependent protein